ncbi:hypothetical protein [Marinobacter alexandrii]|uniref:hypothetical protein n=1 Tax=Marinobacter alexandrii TaxID=2570351 RepID=UPI0032976B40
MKAKKLIAKMQALLSKDERDIARQKKEIEKLLVALEAKEQHFRHKLELADTDVEREKLERKIAVCNAQRQKGGQALISLKED